MDKLGYDEAWIGEHHSAGYELIAIPEVFIAAAAERTRHIRLGTGVSSLPYHHPLMLADRINQLDHMTRGRVMFGVGPGALAVRRLHDGHPGRQAARPHGRGAGRASCACCAARRSPHKSDWFELDEARLQMTPYSRPSVEIAVASQVSPTGARAAGQHGAGPAVDRRHLGRRLQRAGLQLGHRRGAGRRARPDHGPHRLAAGRPDAHRRDPRAGEGGRRASAWRSGSTTSARSPTCRSSREGGDPVEAS